MTTYQEKLDRLFDLEETIEIELGLMSLWDLMAAYVSLDKPEIREERNPQTMAYMTSLEQAIEDVLEAMAWDFSFDHFYNMVCQKSVFGHIQKAETVN